MSDFSLTRRQALSAYACLLAGSPLHAQKLIGEPAWRTPPVTDLLNAFEFELMAQRKLDSATYAEIAGGDRRSFDRITFRPRLMVNTTKLDLTTELFGETMFTPIMIGPVSHQKRFHPDGEIAMARGAAAAKAVLVISTRSSHPLEAIVSEAKAGFWYQVYPEGDVSAVRTNVQQAVKLGCKAVCLTLGIADPAWDWNAIDRLRDGLGVPFVLKGIMNREEAELAVKRNVQGIVVSSYAGPSAEGLASPIDMLPAIADTVAGKIPVLIDGGFRRGSDVLKALALGARAVLLGRVPLWGLSAYGAAGVQNVIELLQNELARDMAMCGRIDIKAINRSVVKIHAR